MRSSSGTAGRTGSTTACVTAGRSRASGSSSGSHPEAVSLLRRIAVDVRPLRESRDFRLLTIGSIVTGLGAQAALVALPYQVYVVTRSPFLTGLLGLAELFPLMAASLFGGALADRFDRRRVLLLTQLALVAVASGLSAAAFAGTPPVWLLYV